MLLRLLGSARVRRMAEVENAALADRINGLGEERVEEVILSSSPDVLGVWLTDPNAK